ncbi:hypothetical protein ACF1BB_20470 [Streptomyces griseoluteus]|uniref:hypothetical protein n=1 Tax=Streptomyces griseoluteus TaxID=29306 RepID=UPI0036F6D672
MAHSPGKTSKCADFESLRARAVALRREGMSLRQIRDHPKIHNNDLREQARELRRQGRAYDQIEAALGCSRSSVSLRVRDLPKPERKRSPEEAAAVARKGWEEKLRVRGEERRRTKDEARRRVGALPERELFLVGVGLYWAEGAKDKPYDRREDVTFVNSDPGMITTFLARLDPLGVERERLRFTVMIHETADVAGAERFWAEVVDADRTAFNKTSLKKHNPKTVRRNTGDSYRGCLVIKVLKSADLYRRIEGARCGIVEAAREADQSHRT